MAKYHINKHGVPAVCRATKGNCPLGGSDGNENHFDSAEEAQAYIDNENEKLYGLVGKTKIALTKEESFDKTMELLVESNSSYEEDILEGEEDSYSNLYGWSPGYSGHHEGVAEIVITQDTLKNAARSLEDYKFEGFLVSAQKEYDENLEILKNNQSELTNEEKEELMRNISDEYIAEYIEEEIYGIFESEEFDRYIKDKVEREYGHEVSNIYVDTDSKYGEEGNVIGYVVKVEMEFDDPMTKEDYEASLYDGFDDF